MRLVFLGCGGWIPRENETSCFAVEHKDSLILLDAGTGIANLPMIRDIYSSYDTVSIILSHYHLDHIIGLIYLLPYLDDKTINIYGPGKPVYGRSTEEILSDLFQQDLFSRPLNRIAREVNCIDYGSSSFDIKDIHISVDEQKHSSPSFQITIDDVLRYSTDTSFDVTTVEKGDGAKVLLHECWNISGEDSKHTSLEQILKQLNTQRFDDIYLIHQNPVWTESDIEQIRERIQGTNIHLPHDGERVEIW